VQQHPLHDVFKASAEWRQNIEGAAQCVGCTLAQQQPRAAYPSRTRPQSQKRMGATVKTARDMCKQAHVRRASAACP